MATLADELLADLMESGSEGEGEDDRYGDFSGSGLGDKVKPGDAMVDVDEDEEEATEDEEETYKQANASKKSADPTMTTGAEAKARVEKQTLMKALRPVLEVSDPLPSYISRRCSFTRLQKSSSNFSRSHTENRFLPAAREPDEEFRQYRGQSRI
jgi:hypothetical protein